MTLQQFESWLNSLKIIWETKKPNMITELCANEFRWYENPFDEPLVTKDQLLEDWNGILKQDEISFSYEILSSNDTLGIVQWQATFIRLPSKEKIILSGIFKIFLTKDGKCKEFHQWYHAMTNPRV